MKLMTELESFGLFKYLVGTQLTGNDIPRLKELAISISMLADVE